VGRALLIVDMQEVLIPVVWRGEALAARIATLARSARDRDVPVIALQQTGPVGSSYDPGEPGWRLSGRLGIQASDVRVRKAATDGFFRSDLADVLAARDVGTVIVTGVATDYCVDATARSALSHGLDVVLVSDGHAPAATGNLRAGLAPQQIVDHHNWVLSQAIHPGGRLHLVPAADVFD
jgi:nicotinamidase-related amidase